MRYLIGIIGLTLIGIGVSALIFGWDKAMIVGIILLGIGFFIDSLRKDEQGDTMKGN